jgi:hypothetical protein
VRRQEPTARGRGPADDERPADAVRQLLERHNDLHVIVTEYLSALADASRAPATIERALAAIAAAHRAAGAGALRTDGPRQVLRSYPPGPGHHRNGSPGSARGARSPGGKINGCG